MDGETKDGYIPTDQPRSDIGIKEEKKAVPTTDGETSIHPSTIAVQDWARAVVSGENEKDSRARILETFQGLPDGIKGKKFMSFLPTYADEQHLKEMLPTLVGAAQQIPDEPSAEQVALLGFTKLAADGIEEAALVEPLQLNVDLAEFRARLGHAQDFNREDWLASLAMITWDKGQQREMQAKTQVREQNLQYLLGLQRLSLDGIKNMYGQVINAIYPNPHNIQTFREEATAYDTLHDLIKDPWLSILSANTTAIERENAVESYLAAYNELPGNFMRSSSFLAKFYAGYLCIHPHPDGNGTMAKTLIDNYLVKDGLSRINWDALKTNYNARASLNTKFEEYIYKGDEAPLQSWFEAQIHPNK